MDSRHTSALMLPFHFSGNMPPWLSVRALLLTVGLDVIRGSGESHLPLAVRTLVFDFYRSGWPTVLDIPPRRSYGVDTIDYDDLIVGPNGVDQNRTGEFNAEFIRGFGDPDDMFARHADLYTRLASAPATLRAYDASFEQDVADSTP